MASQAGKAAAFKALHERPDPFVVPNPWDAGTAKILAALGFEALATTSAGLAFSLGRPDGEGAIGRDEAIANAHAIAQATELPVTGDLENGFEDDPLGCADIIRRAAEIGLVGASIEDATGRAAAPIYPFELAVERVQAAVQAARTLPFPFMVTARAENMLYGRLDLADTVRRLEAFAQAGADVLYAPALRTPDEIRAVVTAVAPKPVNVVVGLAGIAIPLEEFAELGVKRISLGSTLARAALGALIGAAQEMKAHGTFDFARQAVAYDTITAMFAGRMAKP